MLPIVTAELAWYVTGRFYASSSNGALADYGYFLHLAGIAAPLFSGALGEATAHFTFAAQPFLSSGISNGALSLSLDPVGEFSLYLQRTPGGNFDDPATFAQGENIATLRRISIVVGTAVNSGSGNAAQTLLSSNVFSARLVSSTPFEFGGVVYDLADILGPGVTQFGTAAATAIDPPPAGYSAVLPFSGSAIRLGQS